MSWSPGFKPLNPKTPSRPLPIGEHRVKDIGNLTSEFEALEPDRQYSFVGRTQPASWNIVEPKTAPPIGDLPLLIKNLIKATWKVTEPTWDNQKGSLPGHVAHGITIGTRGGTPQGITIGQRGGAVPRPNPSVTGLYSQQVRPTAPVINTTMGNDSAIASDWNLFNFIKRTNAVTFRGDSRSPVDVITKAGGFHPPNSRTDRYYIENNIYPAFADYLKRRYQRDLTQKQFLIAYDSTSRNKATHSLIVDYMMWKKITEREKVHLGRMVENECLKGYISTAKSIDTSLSFATRSGDNFGVRAGWLYLTVVHAGFMVPDGAQYHWGSEEAEIAQWGPIPAAQIVGFVHVEPILGVTGKPDGPIYIRRSFRTSEPAAFEQMFKVMSGKTTS